MYRKWFPRLFSLLLLIGLLCGCTKQDFTYKHEKDFILLDGDKVYPAKMSSFSRLFPDKKKTMKTYVKDNDVDTDTQSGLTALFDFCSAE